MRNFFIIIFLIIFSFLANSQKLTSFFDEVTISLNKTRVSNESKIKKGDIGFGFGFNKIWLDSNRFNFGLGFYFTRTKQYRQKYEIDAYHSLLDANFFLDFVSIPIFCRFNMGKETKLFVETGVFLDFFNKGKVSGLEHFKATKIMTRDLYTKKNNFGISCGLGLLLPTERHEFIGKIEFKYGLLDLMPDEIDYFINQYFKFSVGMVF